jgi:anti-anti-sigma factor
MHGQIDEHTAMCLRNAIDHPVEPATQLVIDLRDLTAINSCALALLIAATARCKTRALGLTLLLNGGADHAAIADALVRAGFDAQVVMASRSCAPSFGGPKALPGKGLRGHDGGALGSHRAGVGEMALRLRHFLLSHHLRGHRPDIAGDHREDEVRRRCTDSTTPTTCT